MQDFLDQCKRYNWKVFIIGAFIGAYITFLRGVEFPPLSKILNVSKVISPLSQKVDIFEDKVVPRLTLHQSNYTIQEESNPFIKKAQAQEIADYNNANAYIVVDFDSGDVIAQKNSEQDVKIASLTKVMTAVVALDLADPNEEIIISKRAQNQTPTKIGVIAGQKMTVSELLHALLMTSANDSAQAIHDGINEKYGEDVFISAMNKKAQILGLTHSSFDNPQGFDGPQNYSSAKDLAKLSHFALSQYPLISEIVEKEYEFLPASRRHKQFDLYNWNGLIGVYPNVKGVKIGNTDEAGKTTIVMSEKDGRKVLVVLLGAPDIYERDLGAAQLLDVGFEKILGSKPVNISRAQLDEKYASWVYY